jgi:2-methylisocitrate lyase-like PEP mutase family enzyme
MRSPKLLAALLLAAGNFASTAFAADPAPCEQSLNDLKAAVASSHPSDADKAKVADLQSQGIERCKADDDAGADALFAEAMKLLGK